MIIYSTPDICPIYNYMQVVKTNDLRWLIKSDDYSKLPEMMIVGEEKKVSKKLFGFIPRYITKPIYNYQISAVIKAWESINTTLESGTLDLSLERLRMEAWKSCLLWIAKDINDNKYNAIFAQLKLKYDELYFNFRLDINSLAKLIMAKVDKQVFLKLADIVDKEYKSFSDMYFDCGKLINYDSLLRYRMHIIDAVRYDIEPMQSFNDEVASIEMILNNRIDVMTCSVSKYFAYKKQAKAVIDNQKLQSVKRK